MDEIEVVIKIPKILYAQIQSDAEIMIYSGMRSWKGVLATLLRSVRNGTPQSNTWSLDDAREDFMYDVYNTLDFLPTNEEANRIIDSFDRVTSSIEQELALDKIRADIGKSKTEHEMQIAEGDIEAKLLISHIYCDIINIFDKYMAESKGI